MHCTGLEISIANGCESFKPNFPVNTAKFISEYRLLVIECMPLTLSTLMLLNIDKFTCICLAFGKYFCFSGAAFTQ